MAPSPPQPGNLPEAIAGALAPRIPSGGLRELGPSAWLFCKLTARAWGVPEFHLFTVLAQNRRLFWPWLPFSGVLLYRGRLPKQDTEAVILRIAHVRGCEYELQQHRRLAARRGVGTQAQADVFAWPSPGGLSARTQALLTGVDELLASRTLSEPTWQRLSAFLDRRQLIEFVTLVGQYDALALSILALGIPLD